VRGAHAGPSQEPVPARLVRASFAPDGRGRRLAHRDSSGRAPLERWGLWPQGTAETAIPELVSPVSAVAASRPYRSGRLSRSPRANRGSAARNRRGPAARRLCLRSVLSDFRAALATCVRFRLALPGCSLCAAAGSSRGHHRPIMAMLGAQLTWYDQLGYQQSERATVRGKTQRTPQQPPRSPTSGGLPMSTQRAEQSPIVCPLVAGRTSRRSSCSRGRVVRLHADYWIAAVPPGWPAAPDEVIAAFEQAQAAVAAVL